MLDHPQHAEKVLLEAVREAEKAASVPQAQSLETERLAMCLMGLGYCYAVLHNIPMASEKYRLSLNGRSCLHIILSL